MARNHPIAAVEDRLAGAFRDAGWKVVRHPGAGRARPELLVRRDELVYAVELKSAPEGRRDRLIPLLAQAILQARAIARESPPAAPLAVIASSRVPDSLADEIGRFRDEYAPDVAVGVIDLEGFQVFFGAGLDALNASRSREHRSAPGEAVARPNLFSDLNQWMLKVLLAPGIPAELLSAPRDEYRNASQLASASGVSVMSAFRFVHLLRVEGFLDEAPGPLRLVRLEELMRRWRAAYMRPIREWPMRWILRSHREGQLRGALRAHSLPPQDAPGAHHQDDEPAVPRLCLALFEAADALDLGFVHGVKPHLYIEQRSSRLLRRLGLMAVDPGRPPDVYVRVPPAPESVFRGAVLQDGVPVADVLQIWLDVAEHPSRGSAQAREIERRVLRPLFSG